MGEYDGILRFMPKGDTLRALDKCLSGCGFPVEEIRLRSERRLSVFAGNRVYFVSPGGELTGDAKSGCIVSRGWMNGLFRALCENSLYAYSDEIRRGFVTIRGGHRAGFCGRAVCGRDGRIENFRDIGSINLRVAREIQGCAEPFLGSVLRHGRVRSTLIVSPPGLGKTTLLRDMARLISNRGVKVGISDDRGEIAAMFKGVPSNDVGVNTDVVEYAPKGEGIEILLRTMSPGAIITDELVTEGEVSAVCCAKGGGAAVMASVHGSSFDDLGRRQVFKPLFENRVFENLILIKGRTETGRIEAEVRALV